MDSILQVSDLSQLNSVSLNPVDGKAYGTIFRKPAPYEAIYFIRFDENRIEFIASLPLIDR